MWWLLTLGLIVLLLVVGMWLSGRDVRVVATITVSARSAPTVTFAPENPEPEDLVRMGLVYAAKLRWVLLTETVAIQDAFDLVLLELQAKWMAPAGDLLNRMTTAQQIRDMANLPEHEDQFVVRYSRTPYKSLKNRSSIYNSLPRDGYSVNGVWTYAILLDAIHIRIDAPTKLRTHRALDLLAANLVGGNNDRSLSGCRKLIALADDAWESAASNSNT